MCPINDLAELITLYDNGYTFRMSNVLAMKPAISAVYVY